MAFQRGLEIALVALALDRHAENVRGALQEGEVMLDELVLGPAVHLEHPERPASPCRMTFIARWMPCWRQDFGVRKRCSFSRWLEITGLPVRKA